jgi:serine protease Do
LRSQAKRLRLALSVIFVAAGGAVAAPRDERRTPVVAAVERVGGSVVNVSAEHVVQQRRNPIDLFFGADRGRTTRSESLGSGVVIAPGVVVTNDHVISGASRIWVTTSDGRELEAKLEGADADNDLAVLSVGGGRDLKPAPLGTTSDLMIGETVIAIGNPFGLSNTVTTGIVSAVHRTVTADTGRNYSDFLQTDAAINPGNSGGALVNILGELIGINTAIVGGANTIGFAIPIDRVRRVTDDLLNYKEVKSVWIGVRGATAFPSNGRPSSRGLGLKVRSVWPGSPAAKAGLAPGDVVVSLDGRTVESREDFETVLASQKPGKPVAVGVRRDGSEHVVRVTAERTPEDLGLEMLRRDIGLVLKESRGGLLVVSVANRSPAAGKGLARGDVVLAVNNGRVRSLDDLSKAVESGYGRPSLVLSVLREPYVYNITFGLE